MRLCIHDKGELCQAHGCRNERLPGRKLCSRHKRMRRRMGDPIGYRYDKLRQNALRRGKAFSLTRSQFEAWALESGYLTAEGRRNATKTIDRIDPTRGYELVNIQVLTLEENSRKAFEDRMALLLAARTDDDDPDTLDVPEPPGRAPAGPPADMEGDCPF